ncbi:MAG: substrate-binding domain-containing protein [Clostridiales Family XIII bacterium]|jgi:ABC-type sugar transport system substrate-binding protein|nr:substrate-binding domain-containing protein [Clostridiales Family XIII bacterium]
MKRTIAILSVLAMLFMLAACTGDKTTQEQEGASVSEDESANGAAGDADAVTTGWYPDALAAAESRDTYTIVYISIAMTDQLHSSLNLALKEWCSKLNCEYVSYDAKADYDAFLSAVETYASQGVDGLIIDVDVSAQSSVRDICASYDVQWFPAMSPFMDDNNEVYVAPAAILDSYECGQKQVDWMFDSYGTELGVSEVDPSKIGYIFLDWSPHPEIHLRFEGASARYAERYPDLFETNWFTIDVLPGGPENSEGAFDLVSAHLSTNGNKFDYWFIGSATDEFAIGATRAVEQLGLEDKCIISAIMGGSVIEEWKAGEKSAWKSLVTVPLVVVSEPMICGLLSILDGRATYETLWQDSVPAGQTYGVIEFPPEIFTYENKDLYYATVDEWIKVKYGS